MSAGRPLVSVCIPLYNGAEYIRETIESVLAQTFSRWELVITDDGSTDGSDQVVASFSDPRIRYLKNPGQLGVEGNWNRCVNEGRGIYRKLLCHDDRLHPDCLARQVAVLERPGNETVSLVAAARRIIGPSGKIILTRRWKKQDQVIEGRNAIRQIVRSGTNLIGEPGAVLFRASDWESLNGFSARYPYVIDLDFWFQLLTRGDGFYLADSLCDFRVSAQSWSFQLGTKQARQFSEMVFDRLRNGTVDVSRCVLICGWVAAQVYAVLRQVIYSLLRLKKKNGSSCE